MAALCAAMLASDGEPLPRQVSIFYAEFNWKAYNLSSAVAVSPRPRVPASSSPPLPPARKKKRATPSEPPVYFKIEQIEQSV